MKQVSADVGVVVGRFQVPNLHPGHIDLLNSVAESHDRLIIMLGLSPCKCTFNNPLDFAARQAMLREHYPDATIMYIKDIHDDYLWSKDLDNQIENLIGPDQTACLYGSRDSFIPHYHGKFDTRELVQETYYSGTEVRKKVAIKSGYTEAFRAGAIWAISNQYAGPKVCIDVAIFNDARTRILLARKDREEEYRFVGGFVANKESLRDCVLREAKEETHLTLKDVEVLDSYPIDDWRYRSERDKILTVLHTAYIASGKPEPDDDIKELRWFDFSVDFPVDILVPNHRYMMADLLTYMFSG